MKLFDTARHASYLPPAHSRRMFPARFPWLLPTDSPLYVSVYLSCGEYGKAEFYAKELVKNPYSANKKTGYMVLTSPELRPYMYQFIYPVQCIQSFDFFIAIPYY